ncbi:DUF2953 domain-containing protein [Mediterraneibacter agrestimuris]|uniref:DUF2953 domain-containing protein n=1 Tax=Mediterraneibacter agrestimuris TaxID=2941333 RepID=UPI0020413758|nr:DUF2953 domain-containing protein [Mediterraneibacter agrestimuris]
MLHIILAVLRIIGWILLAVLGLVVLLSCIVLFTPLRYEIKAKCDGDLDSLDGRVKFSYFLHLISGSIRYADKRLVWKLRIAWKKLSSEEDAAEAVKEAADEAGDVLEAGLESVDEAVDEAVKHSAEEKYGKPAEILDMKTNAAGGITDQNRNISHLKSENVTETIKEENAPQEKVSCKFESICDKIKELIRKKDIVMDFLTNEIHKAAFVKVISEIKRLLRKLIPKRINGNLEFGFEDPSLTGKVLAGLSILYPYTADYVHVTPQFEDKVLKGDIYVKGSVAARLFVSVGMRLLLNRNIRTTIKHAKRFRLD